MKSKFHFAAALLLALAGAVVQQSAHAYALFLETSANAVGVGQTLSVTVKLDDPSLLASVDLALSFDPAVFSATAIHSQVFDTPGVGVDFLDSPIDNTGGLASLSAFSIAGYPAGTAGPLTLAIFDFEAIATGSSAFSVVTDSLTTPSLGFNLPDPNSTAIPDVSDAKATVRVIRPNQVPEPASLALAGLAIAAAGVAVGRRRAGRAAA